MKINQLTKILGLMILYLSLTISFSDETPAQKKKPVNSKKPTDRDLTAPAETKPKTPETLPKTTNNSANTNTAPRKKVIVVLNFDDFTLGSKKMEIRQQLAVLLANEFSKNGSYKVIEQTRINDVLEKRKISNDERFDPSTAAIVGKELSANPVVLGSITEYTAEKSGLSVMGVGRIKIKAKIGLAIRLVDVNTAEILNSVTVEGTDSKSGVSAGVYENGTIVDEDLRVSLFTKAANNAIAAAVQKLSTIIDGATNFPTSEPVNSPAVSPSRNNSPTSANRSVSMPKIAAIVGANVYITGLGKDVKVGDLFSVVRGVEIKNEAGEVIDFDGREIAKIEITEVRENTTKAKIIKGTGVKAKDFVQAIK